jgi:hypothetical protein
MEKKVRQNKRKREKKSIPQAFCIGGKNGKGQNKIVIVLLCVVKTFRLEAKEKLNTKYRH